MRFSLSSVRNHLVGPSEEKAASPSLPEPFEPSAWKPHTASDGWPGLMARCAGRKIRFETRDGDLHPSPEAMASLLLLPCLRLSRKARLPVAPDSVWLENANQLARIFGQWMGWNPDPPFLLDRAAPGPARPPAHATAAFYTGGLDSLHTLRHSERPLDALVYVIGYDTSKRDFERLNWIESTVRRHAENRGIEAIILRSNLRGWGLFEKTDWHITHGAALAAVGHLLSHRFNHVVIPSSSPEWEEKPIGSNAATDPLWSSESVTFTYDGGQYDRIAKAGRVANHPECSGTLRVCGRNPKGMLNCGRCEKCIRTILCFFASGHESPAILNPPDDLPDNLRRLAPLSPGLLPLYRQLSDKIPADGALGAALAEVLRRSEEVLRWSGEGWAAGQQRKPLGKRPT